MIKNANMTKKKKKKKQKKKNQERKRKKECANESVRLSRSTTW